MALGPPAVVGIVIRISNVLNSSEVHQVADGNDTDATVAITPLVAATITEAYVVTEQGAGGPTGTFDAPFTNGVSIGVDDGAGHTVRLEDGYYITTSTAQQNPNDNFASQEWGIVAYNSN